MSELYKRALEILRTATGAPEAAFRDGQWEAIKALVEDRGRILVVQRTGWGKSALYFVATRLLREQGYGPTIIISPLHALMRNQIQSAARYGVKLGSINSAAAKEDNEAVKRELVAADLDAAIIAPEQLAKPEVRENVLGQVTGDVGMLVVDEAHCISDWGHDFRPDYRRIRNLVANLPVNLPILATTATANDRVMKDVTEQLGGIAVHRGPLSRDSLHLQNIMFPKQSQRLAWLAETIPKIGGAGIVYTATTRDAERVSEWLVLRGIEAPFYHGKLSPDLREELEQALLHNKLKALVATSALGMGYDKPDLAFVIHFQSPGSAISYYQQVGRAGRAIPQARVVLLSGSEDADIQKYFIANAFPSEKLVNGILLAIEQAASPLTMTAIQTRVNAEWRRVDHALRFLAAESPSPILQTGENPRRYARTPVDYELPHESIARLSCKKLEEWETMKAYQQHDGCLMRFLTRQLDDPESGACGKCANCLPEDALPRTYNPDVARVAEDLMKSRPILIRPKKTVGRSNAQAAERFPHYAFPSALRTHTRNLMHEPGRALCEWGVNELGQMAKKGKHEGRFDLRLLEETLGLIKDRWKPEPFPAWVTCVPSHAHTRLVPAFAESLAAALELPFCAVVRKARTNQPQKTMETTFHRCRNLDGVFEIAGKLPEGPVLLIDDAVDSGWTFAVVAALLLRAGSGLVFPLAIMSTRRTGG